MPLRLTCPTCNRTIEVASSQAGQVGTCPHCEGRFRIPDPGLAPEQPAGPAGSMRPCPYCAQEIPASVPACTFCGERVGGTPEPAPVGTPPSSPGALPPGTVPNHLVWSILVTVCCCLIGGIVAIIYSAQVNTKLAQGDLQGARSAAHTAAVWCWVSGIIGFLLTFGWIALMIVVEAGGY